VADTSQGPAETYADPGYQADNMKRYPLTLNGVPNRKRIMAAYAYINIPANDTPYTAAQIASMKSRIMAAGRKMGITYDADSK